MSHEGQDNIGIIIIKSIPDAQTHWDEPQNNSWHGGRRRGSEDGLEERCRISQPTRLLKIIGTVGCKAARLQRMKRGLSISVRSRELINKQKERIAGMIGVNQIAALRLSDRPVAILSIQARYEGTHNLRTLNGLPADAPNDWDLKSRRGDWKLHR
ncbi:hypothetical protein DTO169E5_3932 [Paecilomyces variotii]|nr:hypothetical protein DTO169E5_3932 [Paecilomyces variotii]